MGFFTWHQRQTEQWIARLGITPYQALWWALGKGIVLGAYSSDQRTTRWPMPHAKCQRSRPRKLNE